MSNKSKTQNVAFSIENHVNDIRVWMQQKSKFALENLCLSLSNGEFVSCTAAGKGFNKVYKISKLTLIHLHQLFSYLCSAKRKIVSRSHRWTSVNVRTKVRAFFMPERFILQRMKCLCEYQAYHYNGGRLPRFFSIHGVDTIFLLATGGGRFNSRRFLTLKEKSYE